MKLACITGASSGIGRELAFLLAKLDYDLIIVGRNTDALHEIADNVDVKCKCITCDLSDEKLQNTDTRNTRAPIFIKLCAARDR